MRLYPLWDELFPSEQARIVQLLIERVDVGIAGASIKLRAEGLSRLSGELRRAPAATIGADGKTLTVYVPLSYRKRGGRKLVISPGGHEQSLLTSRLVNRQLLRSVVRAFEWQRLFDQGQYTTIGELAKARKLDRSFVSDLSPDPTRAGNCQGTPGWEADRSRSAATDAA